MAREIWKGAISFGLVNIPVDLYSGEKSKELKFTLLDRRNMAPVGYRRVNKETGKEVPLEEIVKGYEYEKDRFVVVSDEDFRQANVQATQTIEIVAFIQADEINPIYFDRPYFLTPGKAGGQRVCPVAGSPAAYREDRHRQSRDPHPTTSRRCDGSR